jgi:hypothetical protein
VPVLVIIDFYGNLYISVGIGVGKTAIIPASANLGGGWLTLLSRPSETQVKGLVTELVLNFSVGVAGGGGVTWNPQGGAADNFALEGGVYSPQIGVSATWGFLIYDAYTYEPWFFQWGDD